MRLKNKTFMGSKNLVRNERKWGGNPDPRHKTDQAQALLAKSKPRPKTAPGE